MEPVETAETAEVVDMVAFLGNSYHDAGNWAYYRMVRVWEELCTPASSERRMEVVGNILMEGLSSHCQMTSSLLRVIVPARIPSCG